jgi:DNA-binding LacI/PurR family transcriptional regulator
MNNHPSVNPVIRRVVLETIAELEFRPNAIARTLRTARTGTLGLVMSSTRNADLASASIQGAEAAAYAHGYVLIIANARRDPVLGEQYLRYLTEGRVDGLLCNPSLDPAMVRALVERTGLPTVIFGRSEASDLLPSTVLSFDAATEEAIDHLIHLGHRRIGTITDTNQGNLHPSAGWGVAFVQRVLTARGLTSDPRHHLVAQSADDCTRLVQQLFWADRQEQPTALLISPLYLAPATIEGVRAAGASIPRDVSLVGFGDSAWARVVQPALNVVAADLAAHHEASTRLLIRLIEKRPATLPSIEHRAEYIRRASVAPPCERPQSSTGLAVAEASFGEAAND